MGLRILTILFLFTACTLQGQNTPASFLDNLCDFKTDGQGKSMGLKIKISVPCDWEESQGQRPHIIRKFIFDFKDGGTIGSTISVKKLPTILTKKELFDFFSEKNLKEMIPDEGTFISSKKVKADGIDCGELQYSIKSTTVVSDFYIYFQEYSMIYKDKYITITYAATGQSLERAKELMGRYQILFKGLMNSFVLLNQWEK